MKSVRNYFDKHLDESISINEIGMKLIPDEYSKIKQRLQCLELRAPAMSSIQLKLECQNGAIIGTLSIKGYGKSFESTASGKDPRRLYTQLEKNIEKQLYNWKKRRILNRFTGTSTNGVHKQLTGGYAV